ncbi:GntR family transcriptional regulator [Companilactobacillus allii]|uniref:GntR family transcriptional regulator n=1 Tax=Companilactobacillus allii TaxID=1847728 RepID=A0A1P8Q278_9LACO|nr:GntR family transcriptional regulator [Companilactobacillus allii]APX71984.1 GntR family transcriptional regulator [Companilactobacillus allii]USQ69078.1 GntR family transcriptional regulator [Companilactobacillus allii]
MKITLQEQLINLLTNYIQSMPANAKLPSERKLSDKYELSRTTVRSALNELEVTGLIRRVHGKGTFVNRVDLNSDLNSSYSFNKQMMSIGKKPQTKILSFDRKEANSYFARKLDVEVGDQVIKIKRLRLADDVPVMLERTYLPANHFNLMTEDLLEDRSLYDVFDKEFNEPVYYADEYFLAGIISKRDSEYLDLAEGTPCLNLKRSTYNSHNQVIEFTLSVARSDQFAYHIRHDISNKS